MSTGIRWRTTNRAQRRRRSCPGRRRTAGDPLGARAEGQPGELGDLAPAKPSIAGSSVSAISSATATEPAAARPMTVRKGMPTTVRPHSAMITVRAAKTTEPPAVPAASPTDSSASCR